LVQCGVHFYDCILGPGPVVPTTSGNYVRDYLQWVAQAVIEIAHGLALMLKIEEKYTTANTPAPEIGRTAFIRIPAWMLRYTIKGCARPALLAAARTLLWS
jgi:hypothetical protein